MSDYADFSTEHMMVKATEYHLWHDTKTQTVTITVMSDGEKKEITFPDSEMLNLHSLEEHKDFIADKIRTALAEKVAP